MIGNDRREIIQLVFKTLLLGKIDLWRDKIILWRDKVVLWRERIALQTLYNYNAQDSATP